MVRVLVTGGSGFVGGAILSALSAQHPEYELVSADIRPAPKNSGFEHVSLDIRLRSQIEAVFARVKPHVVVHTAGIVPQGPARYNRLDEAAVFEVNAAGTQKVVEVAAESGVQALVYTSSCCIITDDHSHDYPNFDERTRLPARSLTYGESKVVAERAVLAANSASFQTCALRPSVILGPGDAQLVPALYACIAKGETAYQIGGGDNLYDFTYVTNIADAHVLAVENLLSDKKTAAGEAFSISNGEPITFRDFCLAVWAGFDHVPAYTIKIPGSLAWFAGMVSEGVTWLTGLPSTLSRGSVNDALGTRYANITKARRVLGYEARVSLAEGVIRSCEAYKEVLQS